VEATLGRVINPDSAGRDRARLSKAIVLTIHELAKQAAPSPESRDMAAFISLALEQIAAGIDVSVAAWEKRGYWVKADRFRMDWLWAGQYAARMRIAILADDWASIAQVMAQTAQRLSKVEVSQNHRLGTPWVGAYAALHERQA
jgi:hypothetical protein